QDMTPFWGSPWFLTPFLGRCPPFLAPRYTDMESEDYHFYQGLVYLLENDVSTLGYDLTFSTEDPPRPPKPAPGPPWDPQNRTRTPLGPPKPHQDPPWDPQNQHQEPPESTGTPIGPPQSALGPSQDPQNQHQEPPGTPKSSTKTSPGPQGCVKFRGVPSVSPRPADPHMPPQVHKFRVLEVPQVWKFGLFEAQGCPQMLLTPPCRNSGCLRLRGVPPVSPRPADPPCPPRCRNSGCPNGANVLVTEENKKEYVHLVCQMRMTGERRGRGGSGGAIRKQLAAFLEGFYEIIPKRLISIFTEQELELLISGLPTIDIDDLKANTEYHKYQGNSIQVGLAPGGSWGISGGSG
ncbi:hypothetical protein DV515_00019942, partial [Chloebia gouldiae]